MMKKFIGLVILSTVTTAFAAGDNFPCPQPSEIQSTDFTAPSIWTAPPMAHSAPGTVGLGLGGKEVKEFLGSEAATVNHQHGWVCVYRSNGGLTVGEYESKMRQVVESTGYLRKYLDRLNKAFENAEPYLKRFPRNIPLGFVGYQQQLVNK
ncbi:hypothetical protein AYO45_02475 [Gammaproteobacteria bacterium SCGC AG-212-F23]|nr:hypothetical protein AYO45_02475 [Gammaproteobacteria bacterium SCGC AG-212-F23]